jgi:3'(2'), 5'-bisphosphate nucleotidase
VYFDQYILTYLFELLVSDPLDGTKEFTEGVLDAVTVLIGISVGGRACAGVIHQPFHAHTVAGIVNVGAWHQTNDQFEQIRVKAMDPAGRVVLTTRSHMSADLQVIFRLLSPHFDDNH